MWVERLSSAWEGMVNVCRCVGVRGDSGRSIRMDGDCGRGIESDRREVVRCIARGGGDGEKCVGWSLEV